MTYRQFKSIQTRCENIYKELKEEIYPLYKKRMDLFQDLQFFLLVREHERIPKLSVQDLNEARARIMYQLATIDLEVKKITDKMIVNHKKKVDAYLEFRKHQQVVNGFQVDSA